MMTARAPAQPPADDDLELLLPFYATGALPAQQARQIEARLADDAEFRRRLDLIDEERDQTARVNASIAPPSSAARDRLFAMIDAETRAQPEARQRAPKATPTSWPAPSFMDGLRRWFASLASILTPRAMGYVVAGLAALAVVQASLLAHLASGGREAAPGYVTASGPAVQAGAQVGAHALVKFAPGATMAQASEWLAANGMQIVDGPKPGGLWRLRIAGDNAAMAAAIGKLQANPGLFATVLPE